MVDFVVGKDDDFGKTLARGFNCEYRSFKQDLYPDGEPYPIIEADYHEMRGKEVIFAPRSSASSELRNVALELHIYQRIVASLAAQDQYDSRLDLVYPYFWLARQDHNPRLDKEESIRRRDKGKDVGYQYIIKAFKALGARRIVTVNPHFHRTEGSFEVAGAEIISVTGIPAIARYLKDKIAKNTLVVGPDMGASMLSRALGQRLDLASSNLLKKRLDPSKVQSITLYDTKGTMS